MQRILIDTNWLTMMPKLWSAARLNQINVFFSENFQDGQMLEGVRFVNPFAPQFSLDRWT